MKSIVLFASILRIILITAILCFAIYANAGRTAGSGMKTDSSDLHIISRNDKTMSIGQIIALQKTLLMSGSSITINPADRQAINTIIK